MLRSLAALLLLAAPVAAEFTANHLFVCAADEGLVVELDAQGNLLWQLGAGSGLSQPAGLAFGADGLLYVSSFGSARVLVFDAGGNLVRTLGADSRWMGHAASRSARTAACTSPAAVAGRSSASRRTARTSARRRPACPDRRTWPLAPTATCSWPAPAPAW